MPEPARAIVDLPCLFTMILGLQCPGCGLKTAIVALIDGDLSRALTINPVAPIVLALMVLIFVHGARDLVPGRGK